MSFWDKPVKSIVPPDEDTLAADNEPLFVVTLYFLPVINSGPPPSNFKETLDENLKLLNDDYRTERICALKNAIVDILPEHVFHNWMKSKGKQGGQHKFPRVMKGKLLEDWKNFINQASWK